MKPSNIEYLGSAPAIDICPAASLPEVAVVGRSNVGKSSVINKLLGRKNLARVSATPGKTRALHFYRIENRYHLVDLPGYGYARVSKAERKQWSATIEKYLKGRPTLRLVVLLRDLVVGPQDVDTRVAEWLAEFGVPVVEVLTKADKVKRSKRHKAIQSFGPPPKGSERIVVSAKTGEGINTLARVLLAAVSGT